VGCSSVTPTPGCSPKRSERLLVAIAAQASIAISNAQLIHALREREESKVSRPQ